MRFNLNIENQNGFCIIKLSGRLDSSNAHILTSRFTELKSQYNRFILDLEKLDFLTSAGIGAFVFIYRNIQVQQGLFRMINVPQKIKIFLNMTDAEKLFQIYPNLEDALSGEEIETTPLNIRK